MNDEQNPACLVSLCFYHGLYTTQFQGFIINFYEDPGSLLNKQYSDGTNIFFFVALVAASHHWSCFPTTEHIQYRPFPTRISGKLACRKSNMFFHNALKGHFLVSKKVEKLQPRLATPPYISKRLPFSIIVFLCFHFAFLGFQTDQKMTAACATLGKKPLHGFWIHEDEHWNCHCFPLFSVKHLEKDFSIAKFSRSVGCCSNPNKNCFNQRLFPSRFFAVKMVSLQPTINSRSLKILTPVWRRPSERMVRIFF